MCVYAMCVYGAVDIFYIVDKFIIMYVKEDIFYVW